MQSGKSEEDKIKEAEDIGYQVVGPLDPSSENPLKPYEPVFAVVQVWMCSIKDCCTVPGI